MRCVHYIFMLAVLLLSACGAASQVAGPPDERPAHAAAPSRQLAAISQVLMDTPILEDPSPLPATPSTPSTPNPTTPQSTPGAALTPTPQPSAPSKPVRIVIPDIDMDRPLLQVGVDVDTVPIVPKHDVGWYEGSARPGEDGNIVLWGHALRFKDSPDIPAPFGQLQKLNLGAQIVLYTADGKAHVYSIEHQIWATPDQVEYIRPKSSERVTLISCIGDKIMTKRGMDMTHRLVTIAKPVRQGSSSHAR
jgi:LPXTG-site transpeptidase (sortase) family protein